MQYSYMVTKKRLICKGRYVHGIRGKLGVIMRLKSAQKVCQLISRLIFTLLFTLLNTLIKVHQ